MSHCILLFLAGKGSKGSLHSTDDTFDLKQTRSGSEDAQNTNGNGINKMTKSILKKSDSRDKRDFRSSSSTVGGASSLGSSLVKSYYGSDPERENLLDSCSSDNVVQDHEPTSTKSLKDNFLKKSHNKHSFNNEEMKAKVDSSLKNDTNSKTFGNIMLSGTNNKVDVDKSGVAGQGNQEKQSQAQKLTHEELKYLTGPKLKTGGAGMNQKEKGKNSTKVKDPNKNEKTASNGTASSNPSKAKDDLNDPMKKETAKDNMKTKKLTYEECLQQRIRNLSADTKGSSEVMASEDPNKVDEHLTEKGHIQIKAPESDTSGRRFSSNKGAVSKHGNVGAVTVEFTDTAPSLCHSTPSSITSAILASQAVPTRSPSKLPPYKKPSSNPFTTSTSGDCHKSITHSTATSSYSYSPKTDTATSKPPLTDATIKTPLRIKRKVETSNTVNPSVATVVNLNYREHPEKKESKTIKEQSKSSTHGKANAPGEKTSYASSTTKSSSKDARQYTPSIAPFVASSTNSTTSEENIGRHRVAPSSTLSVSRERTSPKIIQVAATSILPRMESEDTADVTKLAEANGRLPPLASSKEVQTSLLNISLNNKPPAISPSEVPSSKGGRGKFERGHQLSKISASKESDLETRKEVGKLIFKMGEELRDLSKKAIPTEKPHENDGDEQDLDLLQPHCSNPLCRHNCPSTTTVSVKPSTQKVICMCGRTMTMISRVSHDTTAKPDDSIVSDVS